MNATKISRICNALAYSAREYAYVCLNRWLNNEDYFVHMNVKTSESTTMQNLFLNANMDVAQLKIL